MVYLHPPPPQILLTKVATGWSFHWFCSSPNNSEKCRICSWSLYGRQAGPTIAHKHDFRKIPLISGEVSSWRSDPPRDTAHMFILHRIGKRSPIAPFVWPVALTENQREKYCFSLNSPTQRVPSTRKFLLPKMCPHIQSNSYTYLRLPR